MKKLILISASLIIFSAVSWGDVTVTRITKSSGFKGWGGMEGKQIRSLKGKRSREESDMKMKGLIGKMANQGETVTLTLLDKSVLQTLNIPKKTYRELSLKDLLKKPSQGASPATDKEKKSQEPTHRVTKSEFKVTSTGNSKKINGFSCQEFKLEMLLEVENLKTKEKTESRMEENLWTTPEAKDLIQLRKEEESFGLAMAKELGLETSPRDLENMGSAMAAAMTGTEEKDLRKSLARAANELKKIKGYPIVTEVEWFLKESPDSAKKKEVEKPSSQDSGVNMSGGIKGALGGFASKMAAKQLEKKMADREKAQEGKPLISIHSEIQSVSVAPVPDSAFEIPAGFKKQE